MTRTRNNYFSIVMIAMLLALVLSSDGAESADSGDVAVAFAGAMIGIALSRIILYWMVRRPNSWTPTLVTVGGLVGAALVLGFVA